VKSGKVCKRIRAKYLIQLSKNPYPKGRALT
jgi:hypothetical protein